MLKTNAKRNQKNQSKSQTSAVTMFEPLEQRQLMSTTLLSPVKPPPVLHAPPTPDHIVDAADYVLWR
jgi:hypothetical protein